MATILVGAATEEVVGERERIAKDAAASVQAAVKGGYVPGGGARKGVNSKPAADCRFFLLNTTIDAQNRISIASL